MATSPNPSSPNVFRSKVLEVVNGIHAAPTTRDILVGLKDQIQGLFNAERMTIFALDAQTQQLYSVTAIGSEVKEIRIPKTFTSIAGFTGLSRQTLNIKDAYDQAELTRLHPKLGFDQRWDKQGGFRTRQVLCAPVLFDKFLMGVLQLVNRVGGGAFTPEEQGAVEEIAKTLGIAFYNQRKAAGSAKPSKYAQLVARGALTEADIQGAAAEARVKNCSIEQVLIERAGIPKADLLRSMSQFYGVPSFDFTGTQAVPDDMRAGLNVDFLRKNRWAPIAKSGREVVVIVDDPHDLTRLDAIRATNLAPKIEVQVAIPEDIAKLIDKSFGAEVAAGDEGFDEDDLVAEEGDENGEDGGPDEASNEVVKLANSIIRDAYKMGVTDIHVEPYGDREPVVIRFRADGDCQVYKEIPPEFRSALVSRFKIMARLDISEKRKPQDGKIRFKSRKGAIELRVASVPTTGGNEDLVMRILASSEPIPIEKMGFSERNLREWKQLLAKPYGICLVVGPTGSGKTTTLHSSLGSINTPDLKIWTAEDPVEITQRGLRQVQVHSKIGLTFAAAMRSFLRADPDVIMVGEMRDRETTQTGIEASLTGHLVFSTLHTNSAAETITRLLDMEIDPFSFADALLGVLAQRLVRKLCACKEAYHPDREEFDEIVQLFGAKYFPRTGISYSNDLLLYRPKGCPECANSGYRGRMGIHELLVSSPRVKQMIQERTPVATIHDHCVEQGMETLMQDGLFKAFQGLTSAPQIRAACMK